MLAQVDILATSQCTSLSYNFKIPCDFQQEYITYFIYMYKPMSHSFSFGAFMRPNLTRSNFGINEIVTKRIIMIRDRTIEHKKWESLFQDKFFNVCMSR